MRIGDDDAIFLRPTENPRFILRSTFGWCEVFVEVNIVPDIRVGRRTQGSRQGEEVRRIGRFG